MVIQIFKILPIICFHFICIDPDRHIKGQAILIGGQSGGSIDIFFFFFNFEDKRWLQEQYLQPKAVKKVISGQKWPNDGQSGWRIEIIIAVGSILGANVGRKNLFLE